MPRHGIRPGDTVYVPGGILHTFGPDTLILEVQQTSDLGQFVMPFDLYGNRLDEEEWDANIEATLDELKTDYLPRPNPGLVLEDGANRRVLCCAGPHFALERWTLTEPYTDPAHPRRFLTLSNVGEGPVELEYEGGSETLGRAESCVLPAAIGEVRVIPSATGEASLVACYVPDLERDVVGPLREAGYSDEEIRDSRRGRRSSRWRTRYGSGGSLGEDSRVGRGRLGHLQGGGDLGRRAWVRRQARGRAGERSSRRLAASAPRPPSLAASARISSETLSCGHSNPRAWIPPLSAARVRRPAPRWPSWR